MLLPWRRKRSQLPRASTAVHAFHCFHAEPKRPAPFTYLQFHAQVVHFVLSRRSSPPAASVFFSDRMGSPGCYEVSSPSPQSSHRPCRFSSWHLSVVAYCGVVPWEKSNPPCILSTPGSRCSRLLSSFIKRRLLRFRIHQWKVSRL